MPAPIPEHPEASLKPSWHHAQQAEDLLATAAALIAANGAIGSPGPLFSAETLVDFALQRAHVEATLAIRGSLQKTATHLRHVRRLMGDDFGQPTALEVPGELGFPRATIGVNESPAAPGAPVIRAYACALCSNERETLDPDRTVCETCEPILEHRVASVAGPDLPADAVRTALLEPAGDLQTHGPNA